MTSARPVTGLTKHLEAAGGHAGGLFRSVRFVRLFSLHPTGARMPVTPALLVISVALAVVIAAAPTRIPAPARSIRMPIAPGIPPDLLQMRGSEVDRGKARRR